MLQKLKLETTIFKNSFPCGFADKKVFVPEFTFTEVVAPVLAFTTEVKVVSNVTHNCYTEYQRDADPERTFIQSNKKTKKSILDIKKKKKQTICTMQKQLKMEASPNILKTKI